MSEDGQDRIGARQNRRVSMSQKYQNIKAAQYIRMSDAQQSYSLESQRQIISEYAKLNNYSIVSTYSDEAKSGVSMRGRDGLKSLMRDVLASPQFSVVLVTDVSRWGRFQDPDEGAHYEFLCRQAGIEVIYCAEMFQNDGSQASAILKSVKRVMAAEYSRQLSARTRLAVHRMLCSGGCPGGPSPYGFAKKLFDPVTGQSRILMPGERKLRPSQRLHYVWGPPEEIAVVRTIFRRYARDGHTPAEIARELNAKGVKHRSATGWNSHRVIAVVENELAVGILAFGKSDNRFGVRQKAGHKTWSRVKVFEPVVPTSLFAKARARREETVRRPLSDETMIQDLRRLAHAYGQVTPFLVAARGVASPSVYARRFGSLGAALTQAGQDYRVRGGVKWRSEDLTWDGVRPALQRLLSEYGYLSIALVDACPYVPRSTTLRRHFGSLSALFAAVGDESSLPKKMTKAWVVRGRRFTRADECIPVQSQLVRPVVHADAEKDGRFGLCESQPRSEAILLWPRGRKGG